MNHIYHLQNNTRLALLNEIIANETIIQFAALPLLHIPLRVFLEWSYELMEVKLSMSTDSVVVVTTEGADPLEVSMFCSESHEPVHVSSFNLFRVP